LACARKPRSEFLGTAIVVYSGEVGRVRLNANAEHVAWFAENFRVTYKMHGPAYAGHVQIPMLSTSPTHFGA
jgi:hypothetical protein